MDEYRLSKRDLPLYLYQVDYPGSRTTYFPEVGLFAANTTKTYPEQEVETFKTDIVKQFTWSCRESLPFINLFSDIKHAENWGLKQPWRQALDFGGDDWTLFEIRTDILDEAARKIFRLKDLVESFDLEIPDKAGQHIDDAYLCLHSIPASAIVQDWSPSQVRESISHFLFIPFLPFKKIKLQTELINPTDKGERYSYRKMEYMEEASSYDYLDGYYYDSEREAVQENYNTIFENNMDDAW
ncbi:hypothetical protein EYB25_006208 [Talaromyces marneffei]|uniref:DUF7587 domain-containing protein n=1 Tax=Talaromyces marneffei (strain ATCC 18224 / CBS 334.59 / QM 7333) TaxID=441960 RepID=B6QJK1_TALMQ|nr:hypothetical protein PMAA_100630 [Talaromyces marneffei ATCC 18224]KAE8552314.1 hypothetical protein EYB25_006208 [Talaromyces marneffei]